MKNGKEGINFLLWPGQKIVKTDCMQTALGNLPKTTIFCLYSAMLRPENV